MEEEQREDGSSRYASGHHRRQNSRDHGSYLRDEYRSPPAEYHTDQSSEQHQQREQQERSFELQPPPPHFNSRRDYQYGNGRELPPVLEAPENLLPPRGSPRGLTRRSGEHDPERVQSNPHEETPVSAIERSLSSVSAGGPLKRSFWHHSRPVQDANANGDYGKEASLSASSSLPQEFMPPKRSKLSSSQSGEPAGSPKRDKEYIVTARSQTSSSNQQQQHHQHHQVMDIQRGNSDLGSLGGALSPRDGWFSRSRSMSWEAREDYYRRDPRSAPSWSSRSPNGRDGPAPMSSGSGPHWMGAPYMPSPRSRHANEGGHYEVPLQPWEASPREWNHHHQPHHHQQYSSHLPYLGWTPGSNGKGGDHQQRENNDNKFARQGQDHGRFGIEQQHPGMHFTDRNAPPQPHGIGPMMGSPMPTSSGVEPSSLVKGQSREMIESDGRGGNKNGPVKLLALPEDRISLSETLCIVREVSVKLTIF